jgi:transposase
MPRCQSPFVVQLDKNDVGALAAIVHRPTSQQRLVTRARIVLLAADDAANVEIAQELGICEDTARKWRARYCKSGLKGLKDLPRSGRPKVFDEHVRAEVKAVACQLPSQQNRPLSTWSGPELVRAVLEENIVKAISASTILRWLRQDALKPWQQRTWIFPRDPNFGPVASIVLDLYAGIYNGKRLGKSDFVISADEKTSIQCRKRVHETLPPESGRPMRVEHEYERGGALAYFGAWDVRDGCIMGRCEEKTGIEPFGRLVDQVMTQEPYRSARRVFWIVDNGSSHRGDVAAERLKDQYSNAIMVHTPVHASWLNQIEIYFSIVQRKVISPNDFEDIADLEDRLLAFEDHYNAVAEPFDWTFDKDDLRDLLNRIDEHEAGP